jgi:putative nucleotidyltransferase with HDIG domain
VTRILFVDDDPYVLEALRMRLRRMRNVWSMGFLNGAAAALAEVEREAPDIVVTDMRMPEMDGAELLARIMAVAPQVTRIVLSGQMDEVAAARAVNVAHRFISKPCEAGALEAALSQALELRAWLPSDAMSKKLGALETLPSLPRACAALEQAIRDPDILIEDVATIIVEDIGMSAMVLKLVNSSFFGLPRDIVRIKQAVGYLGLPTMRTLVLGHAVFQEAVCTDIPSVEQQHTHAQLSARLARSFFQDARQKDLAETAALLHDVGILALESRLPAEHAENREEARRRGLPLHVLELERLSVTHAEVGAYVLGLWGLPREIVDAVARHHAPWSDEATLDVSSAVRVSDQLATELLAPSMKGAEDAAPVPPEILERLGITGIVADLRRQMAAPASPCSG